jgi:hypothetical protein
MPLILIKKIWEKLLPWKKSGNCSVHTVDCHSPALDSGFRRNDASRQAISWFVMPTKVGAFRYPGLFDDCSE